MDPAGAWRAGPVGMNSLSLFALAAIALTLAVWVVLDRRYEREFARLRINRPGEQVVPWQVKMRVYRRRRLVSSLMIVIIMGLLALGFWPAAVAYRQESLGLVALKVRGGGPPPVQLTGPAVLWTGTLGGTAQVASVMGSGLLFVRQSQGKWAAEYLVNERGQVIWQYEAYPYHKLPELRVEPGPPLQVRVVTPPLVLTLTVDEELASSRPPSPGDQGLGWNELFWSPDETVTHTEQGWLLDGRVSYQWLTQTATVTVTASPR